MFDIEVNDQRVVCPVPKSRLKAAVAAVLRGEGAASATISLAVVDDGTIRELNRRYLNHDYATDVLSFPLEQEPGHLEGEVIVSADMATRQSARHGWRPEDELLLYVIHGALHLVGYDDQTRGDRARMREREEHYLRELGCPPCRAGEQPAAGETGDRPSDEVDDSD